MASAERRQVSGTCGDSGTDRQATSEDTLAIERAILGAVLRDPENAIDLMGVPVEWFGAREHREIAEALKAMVNRDEELDLLTVADALRREGKNTPLSSLTSMVNQSLSMNFLADLELLERAWTKRRVSNVARSIYSDLEEGSLLPDEIGAKAIDALSSLSRPVEETASQFWGLLNQVCIEGEAGMKPEAIPTGLATIDIPLGGGLHRKTVTVIGGRTSMGKSALAHQIGIHAATMEWKKVLLFSVEMPKEAFARRTIALEAGIEPTALRRAGLTPDIWRKIRSDLEGRYAGAKFFITDDAALTSSKAAAISRKMKMVNGLDMVIVDYVQRLNDVPAPGENRNQMLGRISRTFAVLARQLDCAVILVSQLNRASDRTSDGKPKLSDLRDSGEIEQDADNVLLIFRPKKHDPDANADEHEAEINIAKQREGPTMVRRLYWNGEKVRFFDLDERRG